MALTQVRALLDGKWVTLTYNDESRAYEGVLVPGATSFRQPGGWYNVEVEASASNGSVYRADGDRFPALRLVVREQTPPALTLVSPPAGPIHTGAPTVTVEVTDGAEGSGVDPDSFSVSVDGTVQTEGLSSKALTGGGYSVAFRPADALPDGPHTLVFTAYDHDGNRGTLGVFYLVDTVNPVISVLSPPEGYITSSRPVFTFRLADEPGGSGVDLNTLALSLDGAEQTEGVSIADGVVSFTPVEALADGPHVISLSLRDNAGNPAALTAAYTVDTVPPELWVDLSDSHIVVDDGTVTVSGRTSDVTGNPVRVTVNGFPAELNPDGSFEKTVPLDVAENRILVRAVDAAGLITDREVYRIRLVTDRTQADLENIQDMLSRGLDGWTDEETGWWETTLCRRGSYDSLDLNRVNVAADYLRDWLWEYGYAPDVSGKRGWTTDDVPVKSQADRYIRNISEIRRQLRADAPQAPPGLEGLTLRGANDIEKILVRIDALRPLLDKSYILSGEAFAGEF